MGIKWEEVFDNYGIKTVTKTDKTKLAYVPNREQVVAIEAAGIAPSAERPGSVFVATLILDDAKKEVKASYYHAIRAGAARRPEPRLGQQLIRSFLNVGDQLIIGNIGKQLFAAILNRPGRSHEQAVNDLVNRASSATVIDRAGRAKGRPKKTLVERTEFDRNPFVAKAALLRSKGKCETPGCTKELFERNDGSPYLEVHHIVPLSEDGDDDLMNVAALCPHCHREQHFGKQKKKIRKELKAKIAKKNLSLGK